ncbi:hypothetical protein ABLE68_00685 [Nocardioides sp. CN2-186]|uniref:hypothetical protein n=1 Tax=Nocardioides tweenelious TaxID=3156607 RepID=UPI0032B3F051
MIVRLLAVAAVVTSTLTVVGVTAPPGVDAPVAAAAEPQLGLVGPTRAVIGARLHLIVAGGPSDAAYAWDTDGDGSFETSTGATPELVLAARPSMSKVAVRAVGLRTSATAQLPVKVVRPTTSGLIATPQDPRPGQQVTFRVLSRSDSERFVAYAWDVEGVPTQRTTTAIDAPKGVASAVQLALDSKGTGYQVTADPTLTVTMPAGKKNADRVISVHVKPISENGSLTNLSRVITMRPNTPKIGGPDPTGGKTVDCDNPPALLMIQLGTCAAIGVFDSGLQGAPIQVRDTTPGVKGCYPMADDEIEVKQTKITELKNLAYPPPDAIVGNLDTVATPGGSGVVGRATPSYRRGKQGCQPIGSRTQSFDFGDGKKLVIPNSGQDSSKGFVFEHTYVDSGTYTITMTTKVPYFGGQKKEGSALKVRWFTATKSAKVTVTEAACHSLDLHGISATPVYEGSALGDGSGDLLGTPCFIPETSLDGHKVYRPELGYYVRLGNPVTGVTLVGDDVLVDPEQGTITSPTGFVGYYRSAEGNVGGAGRAATPLTTALEIPVPAYDPQLGATVAALPARSTANQAFEGLDVTSTQAFLQPGGAHALLKVSTSLPAPLKGATPPVVLDGYQPWTPPAQARARAERRAEATAMLGAAAPDTDFSIDLAGLEVGGFQIKQGLLAHKLTGGWIAGLVLEIPDIGTIDAPYVPPPSGDPSSLCRDIDGPSGLQLGADGGFDFGGAQLELASELPLGPAGAPFAGLKCLAASATGDPFVIVGKVGGSVPKDGFLKVDGCVAFGVLDGGQTGAGCDTSFVAPSDLVWLRTTGTVSLSDYLRLGSGYVDLRVGSDYAAVSMGGEAHFSYANFTVDVGVDGTVVFAPSFAFDLIGRAHICAGFVLGDICGNVQGGVSSKGFGACFDLGGIVYLYDSGWDVFVASCDLKSYLGVQSNVHLSRRSDSAAVTMPPSTAKAAFVVHSSSGRPPQLQVVAPDGTVISDDGRDVQRGAGATITKFATEATTTVTVDAPDPGSWQVRALPESQCDPRRCTSSTPDITVDLRTPIPDPVVTGQVSGSGDTRVLTYDVDADRDDEVVLMEKGAFGARQLGVLDHGASTFHLPLSGIAEKRTVTAVVERNGVPYKTITLDTYQAPAAPKLVAPNALTLRPKGGDTAATWRAVPGAHGYVVRATLTDGRTLRQVVDGTSTVLRGVTTFTAGTVSVSAVGSVGRDSAFTRRTLVPVTRVERRL